MTPDSGEPTAAEVADERSHLFNLAYRMFGSTDEAEDAVVQTYARWYALGESERAAIDDPRAWLTSTAGRLCLAALATSRPVREEYPGEWLPEPMSPDRLSLDESVTMGLLVTLDSLSPAERVAFVLHDVFGMPFKAVGTVVGRTAQSARDLAKSARRRIQDRQAQDSTPDQHRTAVHALRLAAEARDFAAIEAVLDPGVEMVTDGGGNVVADARTVTGAANVAARICQVLEEDPALIDECEVNGRTGLVLRRRGGVTGVVSVNVRDGLISTVWVVLNPDKLRHWNPPVA